MNAQPARSYQIKPRGKKRIPTVYYTCQACEADLYAPLDEAGTVDQCPNCYWEAPIPGVPEQKALGIKPKVKVEVLEDAKGNKIVIGTESVRDSGNADAAPASPSAGLASSRQESPGRERGDAGGMHNAPGGEHRFAASQFGATGEQLALARIVAYEVKRGMVGIVAWGVVIGWIFGGIILWIVAAVIVNALGNAARPGH